MMNNYLEISRELEKHHAVFYMMWELGEPVLTDTIETACLSFDPKTGEVLSFMFNPKLWEESDDYKKSFIISHECMHAILGHSYRMLNSKEQQRFNIAADLVVNHMLVNKFDFDRSKIEGADAYCWVDTIFTKEQNVPTNECIEYYFNKLENENTSSASLVDVHGNLDPDQLDEIFRNMEDKLSDEDKEVLNSAIEEASSEEGSIGRGMSAGNQIRFATEAKVAKKKKWETVINKWAAMYIKSDIIETEQWARRNRRFLSIDADLLLPTEIDMEEFTKDKNKIKVWFFQDTSGSCGGFIDRFFKAAKSLPEDRFDIKMHCFDTRVYETTLESRKLYGFGGTSFSILESYIQKEISKTGENYPEAVFVITDGYGDRIRPKKPEKWHWFLSTTYRTCIPDTCNVYKLSEFE